MWITRIGFDGPPINVFQMWKTTEVSVSQNISMDHVLIKNVCILLCAWAVSPEMWNLWPTFKTALLQFPKFCWTLFLSICTSFLPYAGVCFGHDLLPTVTLAVIHLYVGKLPLYANIPARTEEWHWIMSNHHISSSFKEIILITCSSGLHEASGWLDPCFSAFGSWMISWIWCRVELIYLILPCVQCLNCSVLVFIPIKISQLFCHLLPQYQRELIFDQSKLINLI